MQGCGSLFCIPSTPLQELSSSFLRSTGVRMWVKRDDLTNTEVMGNKWRKLKYNMLYAVNTGSGVATYGGAFSNHIAATAAAGKLLGIETYGIIRGEELNENSNCTLQRASENGMKLFFVERDAFSMHKQALTLPFDFQSKKLVVLPEGGTNEAAIWGASEIVAEIKEDFDVLVTAAGTGGTAAGLLRGLSPSKELWAFSALKGDGGIQDIRSLLKNHKICDRNLRLFQDDIFGGYGRFNQRLIAFIHDFQHDHGILLDPIYTGKAFCRIWDLLKAGEIAKGSRLVLLHSGGLQGVAGFNKAHTQTLPTVF